ncbi:glutamine amidotransferase [Brachybacterium sp. Marseille-Q2903]|uniref:Glutamine amidotransferase n=1 Tax=Brachybacterium epidermidis TaxID=2781983 RepID=A0ABR9VZ78_9MICO|nr:glutamine amidotransferase [Brachybacterium epidermidis]MBE9403188.1 glutamine amidotransferase [Brachybacterium epidermidis]
MRPFLLLATRFEDEAADAEYEAFRRFAGLRADQLVRVHLEAAPLGEIDLAEYSGVIVGGSPFTTSDPEDSKSATQQRVESDLKRVLDLVIEHDVPFLGACYGVGTLGVHQGAIVDRTHGEPVGAVTVRLSEEGRRDALVEAAGLPDSFTAFVGHKEGVRSLPEHAVCLASSATAPVQMFRVGTRQYATQFHPELDVPGLVQRIRIYKDAGYFSPDEMDDLIEEVSQVDAGAPAGVLRGFVKLFAR